MTDFDKCLCIRKLLERKFNSTFTMRVRVSGYIDEQYYRLVIEGPCASMPFGNLSVFGYETTDMMEIYSRFLEAYWYSIENPSVNESRRCEEELSIIATSEEELVLKAETLGLLEEKDEEDK